MRFAMGIGVDGLCGMSPVAWWPDFPSVRVVRPLLEVHKHDLLDVCESEQLEWVEHPINLLTNCHREHFRKVLFDHPELVGGVEQLVRSCKEARLNINEDGE